MKLRFKNVPRAWSVNGIVDHVKNGPQKSFITSNGDEVWIPTRPISNPGTLYRLFLAWRVFKGDADALFWPGND